jgi:hypothetical protein
VPEAEPKIVYAPHSDATLRSELNALATVYKFVLSKRDASQKGVELAPESDSRDDAKE